MNHCKISIERIAKKFGVKDQLDEEKACLYLLCNNGDMHKLDEAEDIDPGDKVALDLQGEEDQEAEVANTTPPQIVAKASRASTNDEDAEHSLQVERPLVTPKDKISSKRNNRGRKRHPAHEEVDPPKQQRQDKSSPAQNQQKALCCGFRETSGRQSRLGRRRGRGQWR